MVYALSAQGNLAEFGCPGAGLSPSFYREVIAFGSDGRVSVRIDCNRGAGTWKSLGPNNLQFGPLALTRAMCRPPSIRDRMAKDWASIRSYVIKDGHLFLPLVAEGGIYKFEPLAGANSTPPGSRVP